MCYWKYSNHHIITKELLQIFIQIICKSPTQDYSFDGISMIKSISLPCHYFHTYDNLSSWTYFMVLILNFISELLSSVKVNVKQHYCSMHWVPGAIKFVPSLSSSLQRWPIWWLSSSCAVLCWYVWSYSLVCLYEI